MATELPKRAVQVRSKRFYVDGVEDPKRKTRFVKITESYQDGRRSRIHMPIRLAFGLRDALVKCEDFCESFDEKKKKIRADPETGIFFTKTLIEGSRRIFCDMIETRRGYPLLRITQVTPSGPRFSVGIAGDGLKKVREALGEVLKELGAEDVPVPEPRHLRIGSRAFHFDVDKSYRGLYMRISEVNSVYRDAITIPQHLWAKFRDIFEDYLDQVHKEKDADSEKDEGMPSARDECGSGDVGEKTVLAAGIELAEASTQV